MPKANYIPNLGLFATVSLNNKIKLWERREKERANQASKKNANTAPIVFWAPFGELDYSDSEIVTLNSINKFGKLISDILIISLKDSILFYVRKKFDARALMKMLIES